MSLLSGYTFGDLTLSNRMVMAPMTRCRAISGNVPGPLTVTYYRQRASAGLIITEGSQVSPMGVGFYRTPGIHSPKQVAGWKDVTGAVHEAGGKIFLQLWHVGRMSHPDYLGGALPVAPSALPVGDEIHTPSGAKKAIPVPRALGTDEIPIIIDEFRVGAMNAKAAGFDGVEVHGANGYLLDQFLRDGSNQRTDIYGGRVENRARLPLQVADAVARVFGGKRVGYRISPHFLVHGMADSDPRETFSCLVEGLGRIGIGYVHLVESLGGRMPVPAAGSRLASVIRAKFDGTLMLNGGYDGQSGSAAIEEGIADLISFGVPFLANPDLPERFRQHAPLNREDVATFYDGEERGYTDYPALGE
ncbi:alkene reductase [Methanoregula sp.]|uniref:alkene reductase n=1 Tax=Methanoregula sp. TaxID=2052170 RepID=UPI003C76885E